MIDVMKSLVPVGSLFKQEKYVDAAVEVERIWMGFPDDKAEIANAYLVVAYAVSIYMKIGDLNSAWRWACLAPMFSEQRHQLGEAEFLKGKVAYEMGELQVAQENFRVANAKSEGRIFHGEDKKYKKLLSEKIGS